jgi:membrane fusion protein (multidrug efflux system)
VGLVLIALLGRFVYVFLTTESTDDSYVSAHVHAVSSRVVGVVSEVLVEEHATVKKGDVLVKIDPRDFEVELKIAKANFARAGKDVQRWAGAKLYETSEKLIHDSSTATYITSEAELEKAQLQLEYTNITAPEDGKIGKRSVETGQQVLPGQPLFALVENKPWITANFKESQFTHIRVGQRAVITVDAVPGREFPGHVVSLSPASGSTFALLPPDNATGNFTKIVQRIPVRIDFDDGALTGFEDRIGPGMSTEVTVYTR